jgi:hypothetical protein
MDCILNFISNHPLIITVPISLCALFFAYRSYIINKNRYALDEFKIYNDFVSNIEVFKSICRLCGELAVKSKNDINIQNIKIDYTTLLCIEKEIAIKEEKLQKAYIHPYQITELKEHISRLKELIQQSTSITSDNFIKLKEEYGFLYFKIFLIYPDLTPKHYKETESEKLNHTKFLNYYGDLLF